MATIVGSASQTCVISTEHTLDTETTAGTYVFQCNLTTALNGDAFRIRIYAKVLTGDTAEVLFDVVYANDQGANPIVTSPPWVSMFSTHVTLTQIAGVARTIPWSLIRVDA